MSETGFKCQKCGKDHDGKFATGRFCSRSCANSRKLSPETYQLISEKLKGDPRCGRNKGLKGDPRLGRKRKYSNVLKTCTYCGMIFEVDHKHGGKKHCTPECHAKHRSQLLKTAYQNGNKKIGGGISKWFQYKDIRVQGTYELRACKIFDSWLSQGIIRKWEYANERVTYTWEDGTEHTYLIDFTIELNNGDAQYFETKGFIREYDERKWEAAKNLGLNIQVWFKEDLDREERKLNMTP